MHRRFRLPLFPRMRNLRDGSGRPSRTGYLPNAKQAAAGLRNRPARRPVHADKGSRERQGPGAKPCACSKNQWARGSVAPLPGPCCRAGRNEKLERAVSSFTKRVAGVRGLFVVVCQWAAGWRAAPRALLQAMGVLVGILTGFLVN